MTVTTRILPAAADSAVKNGGIDPSAKPLRVKVPKSLGTAADPILVLCGAPPAAPMLTLRNYTNFNTLRVNGLDGADTFNV